MQAESLARQECRACMRRRVEGDQASTQMSWLCGRPAMHACECACEPRMPMQVVNFQLQGIMRCVSEVPDEDRQEAWPWKSWTWFRFPDGRMGPALIGPNRYWMLGASAKAQLYLCWKPSFRQVCTSSSPLQMSSIAQTSRFLITVGRHVRCHLIPFTVWLSKGLDQKQRLAFVDWSRRHTFQTP